MSQYAKNLPAGTSNSIVNVAIVGVTGTIGSEITKALLKTGQHKVTAISRTDSKSEAPAGVATKRVDYANHNSIVEALRGQDILVISLGVTAPHDTQPKLIDAAKDAGIQWIMPNVWGYVVDEVNDQFGQDILLGPGIAQTRAYIKERGLSSICLQSGFWEEFSYGGGEDRYGFDIPNRKLTLFNDGDLKIVTSTLPFCGLAVARLLSLPILPQDEQDSTLTISKWRNSALYIGSCYLSQNDRFESALRVTGTKKSDWTVTSVPIQKRFDDAKARMASGDYSAFVLQLYSRIFVPDGKSDFSDKLQNDLLGLPKLDVDDVTKAAVDIAMSGGTKY
ncbi:hypothetical protein AMS68_003251 [Peltaster fructicola]|uniref:Semialdehyde dehydrogenase NAD-binding domain-containing protein n=1 Tax=Peltaster fructicola TaxID=286661 RepID=A0A6H0XSM2_9PEZI|nr:hypothetical protein AMS68_003251 [Peltaster fructicola]